MTTASGWNPDNLRRMGEAIGKECRYYGVHTLLGPGVNIKRNPLCGRNFVYFSEDPFLAGVLGAAEVKGVQSQGVGVSVKHFALNNSENYRFMGNSVASENTIRNLYLKPFEYIVKNARPATLMSVSASEGMALSRYMGYNSKQTRKASKGILPCRKITRTP